MPDLAIKLPNEETEEQKAARLQEEANRSKAPSIEDLQAQLEEQRRVTQQQGELLNAAARRLKESEDAAERERQRAATAAQPSKDADLNKRYWDNPTQVIREIMGDIVKPLNEFKDQFQAVSEYDKMKQEFKNDPKVKDKFLKVEHLIDQMVAGQKPSKALIQAAFTSVIGSVSLGLIPDIKLDDPTPNPNQPQGGSQPTNMNLPPHLRPSAPGAPRVDPNKKKYRDLTENEETLRKQSNLSKEDFLDLIDLQPHQVVDSRIGAPEKKEVK